jgi:hypothetical protein
VAEGDVELKEKAEVFQKTLLQRSESFEHKIVVLLKLCV